MAEWLPNSMCAQRPLTRWMTAEVLGFLKLLQVHLSLRSDHRLLALPYKRTPSWHFGHCSSLGHLWFCSIVWGWVSMDSGSISSSLFDEIAALLFSVQQPAGHPSCHLCDLPLQWHEVMSLGLLVSDFSSLLNLQHIAKTWPDEWQNFSIRTCRDYCLHFHWTKTQV